MELWYCVECGSVRFSSGEPVGCVCKWAFMGPSNRTRNIEGEQPRFKLVYTPMTDDDIAKLKARNASSAARY